MRATTRDGTPIEYTLRAALRRGSGQGRLGAPRLLLLHSLGLDASVWDAAVVLLGDDAEILTLDCRGHGASGKPEGPYHLATFADDCADVLHAVGWERALVVGSSMGGSVALRFATAYPKRVAGLGLVDTTAWYGADAAKNWDERASRAQSAGLETLLEFQETRWFGEAFRAAHPDVVERAKGLFLRNDVAAYAATCRMLGAFDLRPDLASIAVPTEVLVGEEDDATPPEMARLLETEIAGAHLVVLPRARHLTTLEKPQDVAALVRRLIARAVAEAAQRRAVL